MYIALIKQGKAQHVYWTLAMMNGIET